MKSCVLVLKYVVLLVIISPFFCACKEYSFEGGNMAQYTFISSAGVCSGGTVAGQYYEGVALGLENKITLQVDVKKIGQYVVTTTTQNGIHFSSSGQFTTPGIQTISLQGNGIPAKEGNFSFVVPGTSACTFTVTINQKPAADYALAGVGNCQDPVFDGRFIRGMGLSNTNVVRLNVHVNSPGTYAITTDTVNGIYFAASGIFTAVGDQIVTFRGYGTPNEAGNFYFKTIAGNSDCSFKLGVLSPEPWATYVLESNSGNPAPCVSTVDGTYKINQSLTTADSVTIRVYVTVPGNFTISTNKVNGMMFTYSGSFSTIGQQNIGLRGSGTPIAAGSFAFRPEIIGPHPLGGESCAFNIVVN